MTRTTCPFIGLISDTHGLVRAEALRELEGATHIVHAGDVGKPAVLAALQNLAPVTAVRGNVDVESWARAIPPSATVNIGDRSIFVVHRIADLRRDRLQPCVDVVVCGHSHKPEVRTRDRLLLVNPGSAGPRRFRLPVTIGRLSVEGPPAAEIVELLRA